MSKDIERIDNNRNRCNISPYPFTKTDLAGKQRSSMLHSELRLLSELGKSHRRAHKLPLLNFIYGFRIAQQDGGVAGDKEHEINADFIFVRDYSALNKAALEAGMKTAGDQSRFRNIHDINRKIFLYDMSRTKNPYRFFHDIVFGIPNR